jgi:hypothetical protein
MFLWISGDLKFGGDYPTIPTKTLVPNKVVWSVAGKYLWCRYIWEWFLDEEYIVDYHGWMEPSPPCCWRLIAREKSTTSRLKCHAGGPQGHARFVAAIVPQVACTLVVAHLSVPGWNSVEMEQDWLAICKLDLRSPMQTITGNRKIQIYKKIKVGGEGGNL